MHRSTSTPNIRIFISCLLTFLILMAPIASVAAATRRSQPASSRKTIETEKASAPVTQNAPAPQPLSPLAFTVTASLTDDILLTAKKNPGDTINYTATITNTGTVSPGDDATGVAFNDILDSNTTLVGGSLNASPLAFNDSFSTIGNTLLEVGVAASGNPAVITAGSVLTNDTEFLGDTFTLKAPFPTASTNGGTVTMNSSGNFSYLPPAGFTGNDTFTYTITDDGTNGTPGDADDLTGTGTVTVTVNGPLVWYVNNSAGAGDGRSSSPFNSLTPVNGAGGAGDADAAGSIIYVFTGGGNYTTGIQLEANQLLTGNGVALVVNTITLRAAGTRPVITNTAVGGIGVQLASGNILAGFNVGDTGLFDIANTATTTVGTLNISNVGLSGTGGLFRADSGGALTVNFDSAVTTSATGNGIQLTGTAANALSGTFTAGVAGNGISGVTGVDVLINGSANSNTATVTINSNISSTAGGAIEITGRSGANPISFPSDINVTGGFGISVHDNSGSGTITFSDAGKVLSTGTNAALSLVNNTGIIINVTGGGLDIDTTTGAGVVATGGGTVTIQGATNTIDTGAATALNVANTFIGLAGLTFQRISSNGGGAGSTGIILNTVGTTAGTHGALTVTGTGTDAGSGGVITNKDQGAVITSTINLSLKNMNFTTFNGNGTCNNVDDATFNNACQGAINLSSVTGVTLDRLVMSGGSQIGINGRTVTNMVLSNSSLTGFGNAVNENDLRFFNLTGTVSITNSTLANPGEFIVDIRNNTGTLNMTVDTVTFNDTDTSAFGAAGFSISSLSASTINLLVDNSIFTRIVNAAFQASAKNTSALNVDFTDNTVEQLTATTGRAFEVVSQNSATAKFNVNHNLKLYSKGGTAVNLVGFGSSTLMGRVNNNPDIRCGGVGSPGTGISFSPEDNSVGTVEINGNTISQIGSVTDAGIRILPFGDNISQFSATADATIQSNSIALINNGVSGGGYVGGLFGIQVNAGSNASDLVKTCAAVGGAAGQGNAVTAAPLAINNTDNVAFRVRVGSAGSNLYLLGFSGTPVATWNSRNNTPTNSVNVSLAAGAPAPSAPPAAAPYFGVCRTPTNPTALNISPLSPSRDDYAKANSVQPSNNQQSAFASIASGVSASNDAESVQANPNAKRLSHHATFRRAVAGAKAMTNSSMAMAPLAGETVTVNVGTLPAGKVLTIKYAALISTTPTASSVTTQGTVTGSNFAAVSTDDPEPAGANDPTVTNINLPDLTILKSHTGNFRQGDTGKTYTITVSNVGTFATFAGNTVTVTDNLPAGLTVTALTGTGWTCTTIPVGGIAGPTTLTCTRSDSLAAPPPASSYPDITLTVDVAANANPSITNTASVSGGGDTNTANNSSSDSTTVVQVPDLTIDKAHIGSFFQGQSGAQYTVTVGNAGPGPVLAGETITVTDTLPTGLTPTLASGTNWSCNIVAQLVTCTRTGADTALAALGNYPVITVTVDVASNANVGNPGVTNSATVAAGAGVELNTANNTDNDPTQIVAGPDLSIDKSHTGDFTQGETGKTYTIAVSNVGGTATSGTVTVTENLPAGLTATALSGTGWTCTVIPVGGTPGPAVLTCTRADSLAAGGSYPDITLTVDVSLTAPASVNNVATVAVAGDVNAANDSDTDPTTIVALCLTPPADMAAWWTGDETGADPPRDIAGGNDGTLNGDATYAAGKVLNGFTLDGTGDYVEAPDSNSLDITTAITIDAWVNPTNANANGRIVDKITPGNTDGYLFDMMNGNLRFISGTANVQTAQVIPQGVFTHVAVTYDGTNVVFYIDGVAVNTTGATGAIPVNALPLRIGADQAGNFGFAGLIDEVEIFSRALAAGEINDIFTAGTGGKCKPADLTITKTHTDPFVQGSSGNTYTITVHNDGPGATTGTVTVVDTVPAGLTPTSPNGAHNGWNCSIVAQTVTCDRSDVLASGADYPTITLTVTAGANTASVINNVTVSGGGELDASDSFANDTTNLTPSSDLLSVKLDSIDPVTAGANITYDITVTNNGPSDAQSVTLTDAVPANTTFVSAVHNTGPVFSCVNPAVGGTGNVVCSIATMPAGTSSTFTMVVNVNAATAEGTTITNNAVAATTTNDPFPLNNTGTATTSVIQSDIEITSKTDTPDPVEAGSNITYTVNFKNNSAVNTASNVTVTDAVPTGTTFVSAAAPAGWSPVTPAVGGTGNIVFSKALVGGAETAVFTIVVKVDNSVTSGTIVTNTATAATSSLDNVSANNSASTTTTVVVNADLAVTSKTDTPDPVIASQNITYAINFQNNGPSDAQGVTITDAVP
ncbi:MAG TPA: LamG-like jellyroll fold domain-containing protein, partial [Pyrinomonadaceae bacterium]|nr:LamG-like jellyroll fold domain-containing protein [Pyrinomonadaceae bacterium]